MARTYPIPFKRPKDEELREVFGPEFDTIAGGVSRDIIGRQLLALAPTGNHFLYHLQYATGVFASAPPPPRKDFRTRKEWEAETAIRFAERAKTGKSRAVIARALTSYYSTVGQFAVKLDGREGVYIANLVRSSKERPLDYVGAGSSNLREHIGREQVYGAGRSSFVPLVPGDNHKQGVLSLAHWRIPGIQDWETQAAIADAFGQVGTITSEAGVDVSPLSLFYTAKIAVGQEIIASAELFGNNAAA